MEDGEGSHSAVGAGEKLAGDSTTADRPRVIVADPDPLARRVIKDVLQEAGKFIVAAEAADGVELVELALHYRPELVLLEPTLPRLDGFEAMKRIRAGAPDIRIIVLSVERDPELQLNALRAGASGFLCKDVDMASVAQAMHAVIRGEAAVSRELTMKLVEHLRAVPQPGQGMRPVRSILTTREWEVLDLMLGGAATSEIAAQLVLSEDTIYSHVKNIMRKLGVHSRQEAIEIAQQMCRVNGTDSL